jgi:plastocyanin
MARLPGILLGCWRHAAHFLVIFFIAAGLNVWSSTKALGISDSVDSWLSQQNALEPCGAISSVRLFQTAVPVTPTEMPTTDPNAPTPTTRPPSATPRPAPTEDRVGFPEGYRENFKLLFILDRPDNRQVRVICGNDAAASVKPGETFPYGSVLVMENYRARRDSKGNAVLDDKGHFIRESLNAIFVMRKERDFGLDYQAERSGEWEYIAYREDKKFQTTPQNTAACASCHLKQAGESKDFVFRTAFFFDSEKAMVPPPVGENEVNIFLYAYLPQTLTVKVGTTVKWINNDEAEHNVEARDKSFISDMLKTKNIKPGDSFSYTFTKAGTYNYICGNHSGMTARVEVTE